MTQLEPPFMASACRPGLFTLIFEVPVQHRLSRETVAKQLNVSNAFVERMVTKGRLEPDPEGLFCPEQVAALEHLLERLKSNGVGTLLGVLEQEMDDSSS